MNVRMLYWTAPNKEVAAEIVRDLLTNRVIACATIMPIDSLYIWQGKMQHDQEVAVLCKTSASFWIKAKDMIREKHPYEVPAILSWESQADSQFGFWVTQTLNDPKQER